VPDVKSFFRHCPSCGHRFEVRLVSKKLIDAEASLEREEFAAAVPVNPPMPLLLKDEANIVDIEEFEYTYKCKHCGHQWSEIRDEEHIATKPEGYTGD
jgi:DNA-directed RNA polymerase subunit RPC12/RpoP